MRGDVYAGMYMGTYMHVHVHVRTFSMEVSSFTSTPELAGEGWFFIMFRKSNTLQYKEMQRLDPIFLSHWVIPILGNSPTHCVTTDSVFRSFQTHLNC